MKNTFFSFHRSPHCRHSFQRGVTLIELGIVLLIISLIATGIYAKASSVLEEGKVQRTVDDAVLILAKAEAYKKDKGNYDGISLSVMNTAGYSTAPLTGTKAKNPWGKDYALAENDTPGTEVKLTIPLNEARICTRLKNILDGLINNQKSVTCNSNSSKHEVVIVVL